MAPTDFLGPEALAFMIGTDYDEDMPVDQSDPSGSPTTNNHLSSSPPGNLYSAKMVQSSRDERRLFCGPRDEFFRNRIAQRISHVEGAIDIESPTLTGLKHHNSQSLLLRLPDDLHFRIFEICVFGETDPESIGNGWIPQTWIAEITHVCSHWRSLAVSHPILWTYILNFNNLEYAEIMITRSGNMPIDIRIYIPSLDFTTFAARARFTRVFAKLWQVLDRTRSLKLAGAPVVSTWLKAPNQFPLGQYGNAQLNQKFQEATESTDEDLDTSCDHYAALQHACLAAIEIPSPALESFDAITDSATFLRGDILGRNAPKLRCVHLLNYNFTWDEHMPRLSNLTTLRIKISTQSPAFGADPQMLAARVNIRTLVPLLSTLPLLTDVHLQSVFQPISPEDQEWHATHRNPVSLPNLRRLELTASHRHCTIFSQHVSFPNSASIVMGLGGSRIATHECEELLRILGDRLDALTSPRVLKLDVRSVIHMADSPGMRVLGVYLCVQPGLGFEKSGACQDERLSTFQFAGMVDLSDIYPILSLFYLDQIQFATLDSRWVDLQLWKALSVIPNLQFLHFLRVDFGYLDTWSLFGSDPGAPDAFAAIADNHSNSFASLQMIYVNQCLFPPAYSNPMPPMFMMDINFPAYDPSMLAASLPMKQEESYAADIAHRQHDQSLDRYRLLRFLERRKSGQGPLQLIFNCEGLREEIRESFASVANVTEPM